MQTLLGKETKYLQKPGFFSIIFCKYCFVSWLKMLNSKAFYPRDLLLGTSLHFLVFPAEQRKRSRPSAGHTTIFSGPSELICFMLIHYRDKYLSKLSTFQDGCPPICRFLHFISNHLCCNLLLFMFCQITRACYYICVILLFNFA